MDKLRAPLEENSIRIPASLRAKLEHYRLADALLASALGVLIALFLLTSCSHAPVKGPAAPTPSIHEPMLYDFRQTSGAPMDLSPSGSGGAAGPAFEDENRKVFTALFKTYQTNPEKCNFDDLGQDYSIAVQRARKAGAVVPHILSRLQGSFVGQGAHETAYLVAVGECISNPLFSTRRLAIFNGPKLVYNEEIRAQRLLKAFEFVHGPHQLLLIQAGGAAQGVVSLTAQAVDVRDGRADVIQDFGQVYEDTCATDFKDKHVRATAVYFEPGKIAPGKFQTELYEGACPLPNAKREFHRLPPADAAADPTKE